MHRGRLAIAFLGRLGPLLLAAVFAAFPLLSLFQQNETDLELGVLWRPLGVCAGVAVALSGLFWLVFRRAPKAALMASLIVVAFFYYGVFSTHFGSTNTWFLPLWLAVFALAAVALARTRRDLAKLMLVAAVGAVVLVAGPIGRIAAYQVNFRPVSLSDPRLWPETLPAPAPSSGTRRPDIYFIVPDDYARIDVLRQYFHYADTSFRDQLKRRGFVVSDDARSPYSDSEMNIAAATNMGYLDGLASILGKKSQDVRPVRRLIADSRASRLLRAVGYRYIHLDTDEVTFPVGNPHVSSASIPDSLTNLWLQKSVLRVLGGRLGFDDAARGERFRKNVRTGFSQLAAVPSEPGPKFVLFHTLLPHDPYVFGPHGEAVTFPYHSDTALGSNVGMAYYLRQLEYLNGKLLRTIDAIRAHSRTPPVIVIESDEGFQADAETFGEAAMQQIRVKGLSALYLPGLRQPQTPNPPNTVNTLRFVFNKYLGTHYKMLRSASYPEQDLPYQFDEMQVK